jgi:hypothetical protein
MDHKDNIMDEKMEMDFESGYRNSSSPEVTSSIQRSGN